MKMENNTVQERLVFGPDRCSSIRGIEECPVGYYYECTYPYKIEYPFLYIAYNQEESTVKYCSCKVLKNGVEKDYQK